MPEFENRSFEIKLIGGLASFKVSPEQSLSISQNHQSLPASSNLLLTESRPDTIEQKILKLISLFEKGLITEDELKKAKEKILEENI